MTESEVKVLCISGSPREADSKSEDMLRQLMGEVEKFGGKAEFLRLSEKNIKQCEGCYSKTRDGSKCTYPCIHDKEDDTSEILRKIILADAMAISSPVYWGGACALVQRLIEKMTSLENNQNDIGKKFNKMPFDGKPFVLLFSQEAEGCSLASSQLVWALNQMGMMLIPWGVIFKPALLSSKLVKTGLAMIGEGKKFDWIDNTIRLAGRNLVEVAQRLKNFSFDDGEKKESRC